MFATKKSITILFVIIALIFSVVPASAEDVSPVKNYSTAKKGDLLYTVNFKGDSAFTPEVVNGDSVDYIVSDDGSAVTIKFKENGTNQTLNFWGGKIAGLEMTSTSVYTMTYRVKADCSAATDANAAKNNSVGVGGLIGTISGETTEFYNNYSNHNAKYQDDISMRRSAISISNNKFGSYVMWSTLTTEYKDDADGYLTMMNVFNAAKAKMTSYLLAADGTWIALENVSLYLNGNESMGFMSYAYYNAVNTTVRDVKFYKGDLANPEEELPEESEPSNNEDTNSITENSETETTETKASETTEAAAITEAVAESGGCGSSVAGVGVLLISTGVCGLVVSKRRKEN